MQNLKKGICYNEGNDGEICNGFIQEVFEGTDNEIIDTKEVYRVIESTPDYYQCLKCKKVWTVQQWIDDTEDDEEEYHIPEYDENLNGLMDL